MWRLIFFYFRVSKIILEGRRPAARRLGGSLRGPVQSEALIPAVGQVQSGGVVLL